MLRRLLRRPLTWIVVGVLAAGFGVGMYWFQPWKLVTDAEVAEALPVVASPAPSGTGPSGTGTATAGPGASASAATGNTLLAEGTFVTHEHDTRGTARVVRLADGRRQLLLVGLATSNGPDLRVWLADQRVREGVAGWRVFDDGRWLELGRLKGNRGDQVYDIPPTADLAQLRSVSIWCRRFSVSFGAAPLDPT